MICPHCGSTMNHHADKTLPGDIGPSGPVEEIYACPGCGACASRQAIADPSPAPRSTP